MTMQKTPQEVALSTNDAEKVEWIHTETDARKLLEFLHHLNFRARPDFAERARAAIEVLLAEAAERSSQRLEKHTENLLRLAESNDASSKRLIGLTWALVFVSVALLVFAAVQTAIMRNEANAHAHQVQTSQRDSVVNNQQ